MHSRGALCSHVRTISIGLFSLGCAKYLQAMSGRRSAFLLLFSLAIVHVAICSHFRGGIITWRPVLNAEPNTVHFRFKHAWRRSYSSAMHCDYDTIRGRNLIGPDSEWQCVSGCDSSSIASTKFYCTTFSEMEDWSLGENTFTHTFQGPGPFVVSFKGNAWIGLVVGGGDWSMPTTVDLRARTDNGQINSSPTSGTSPIIRLQQHCDYTLPIHADDPDGDEVRCRWAQSGGTDKIVSNPSFSNDECGGVCQALPEARLENTTCRIVFRASTAGWYAVALILEDFLSSGSQQPLSEVPLQFLIEVREQTDGDTAECRTRLTFTDATVDDRHCVAIPPEQMFSASIVVNEEVSKLGEVLLVAPQGLVATEIKDYEPGQRGIDVTWLPKPEQYGQNVFCFSALDQAGLSTEQRCLTLLAGASPPAVIPESFYPFGKDAPAGERRFEVEFDQVIKRPQDERFIRLVEYGTDYPLAQYDTSSDSRVSVVEQKLSFTLDLGAEMDYNTQYYVIIEPGAVVGLQSCVGGGAPFPGISQSTEWYIETGEDTSHPCNKNNGTGDCEFECIPIGKTYQCWCDANNGFVLALDGHSCYRFDKECQCNQETGVCRGSQCDCLFGWKGERCDVPACYYLADCSGNGLCVSPGECSCKPGWGGAACNVDMCSQHKFCDVCSERVGCGWCEESKICMAGSGYGPLKQQCRSWWYYYCFAAVVDSTVSPTCSDEIPTIDCNEDCLNNNYLQASGPGSQDYCDLYSSACRRYSNCYTRQQGCLSWKEDNCRFGLLTLSSGVSNDFLVLNTDLSTNDYDVAVRIVLESNIFPDDHGILLRIAQVETKSQEYRSRDGIFLPWSVWPLSEDQLEETKTKGMLSTLREQIQLKLGVDWTEVSIFDLQRPVYSALAASLLLSTSGPVPSQIVEQAKLWKQLFNPDGNEDDFTQVPRLTRRQAPGPAEGCIHGILDERTGICLCKPGYKGKRCDEPDCNCDYPECSGNGMCVFDLNERPVCTCNGIWIGDCCEICPPVQNFGDPHLQTIDGFEFDYFGIGEFISCYSEANEFGVQLRFFKYKNTSMIGDVAVKIGTGVANIVSVPSVQGKSRMPQLRINGTVTVVQLGRIIQLGSGSVTLFMRESNVSNSLVQLFFQFKSGATYTIEIRYSDSIGRQFLDTSLGAPVAFMKTTRGLCGNMDGDPYNDYLAPNGNPLSDATAFAESWRVGSISRPVTTAGYEWQWEGSNFHADDPMTNEYLDPNHMPNYSLDQADQLQVTIARESCMNLGLQAQLLQDCILDVALTGDLAFLEQQAFHEGECPFDCSNHGDCLNGTCQCYGLWTGAACDEGGCRNCSDNSTCVNGFCICDFGFYEEQGQCVQASCVNVNDCTSPVHGRCRAPDDCLCNPGFGSPNCSQTLVCYDNCSGHGLCYETETCICHPNWGGPRCNVSTCSDLQNCLGRGNCTEQATCDCFPGWLGSNCGLPTCANVGDCSSHGRCIAPDTCRCYEGFSGVDCSVKIQCPIVGNCSNNGLCISDSKCQCFQGFTGVSCETAICIGNCSGQGRCVSADFCICNDGWIGANCSQLSCESLKFCSGHGTCVAMDTCQCNEYWKGDACDVPDCPSPFNSSVQCHGHGTCIGPASCECDESRYGNLCQTKAFPQFTSTPQDLAAILGKKGVLLDIGTNTSELAGENVVLSCYAEGFPTPTVQIYHGDVLVKTTNIVGDGILLLTRVSLYNAGRYRCIASNSKGEHVKEAILTVFEKPFLDFAHRTVEAYEGDKITLTCKPTGYPKPNVTWTLEHDGIRAPAAATKGIRVSRRNGASLVIGSMAPTYQGRYVCKASNYLGEASQAFDLSISTCQPTFTMREVPECVATILVTEESLSMANDNRHLIDIVLELESELRAAGIGVKRNFNKYAVVGFGTKRKARIITDDTRSPFFGSDSVSSAVSNLRRDGRQSDGYHAIRFALKNLPLPAVRHCALHLLLATDQPRIAAARVSKETVQSLLCERHPILFTALLNGGFTSSSYRQHFLGVGSDLFPYASGAQEGVLVEVRDLKLQPASRTICQTFSDYGIMALNHHGSVWDMYRLGTLSSDAPAVRAIANATVSSAARMKPCRECVCKKTGKGHVLRRCSIMKHPSYCNCRRDGQQRQECTRLVRGLCDETSSIVSSPTAVNPQSLLPPSCLE